MIYIYYIRVFTEDWVNGWVCVSREHIGQGELDTFPGETYKGMRMARRPLLVLEGTGGRRRR